MMKEKRMDLLTGFWTTLDLSDNLRRASGAIKDLHGMPAMAMMMACAIIATACGVLALHFDILPTLDETQKMLVFIAPNIIQAFNLDPAAAPVITSLAWIGLCITLLPTAVELFGSRIALANVVGVKFLLSQSILIDALTDVDPIREFLAIWPDMFSEFGSLAFIPLIVTHAIGLFIASFYLEMLACLFGALTFQLATRCIFKPFITYLQNRRNGVKYYGHRGS